MVVVRIISEIIGLGIVGLLITFLPTIYTAYSQREQMVTRTVFRRSPQPGTSWITTAGAVLDAGALLSSTVERQNNPWVSYPTAKALILNPHLTR